MKNPLLLLIACITVLSLSCNHDGPKKSKRTVITGHIKNLQLFPDDRTIAVDIADFGANHTHYTGAIKDDGTFKIAFDQYITQDVKLTQSFRMSPVVEALIAHPGDSINIEFDYKDVNEVKFSGDGAATNSALFEYTTTNYTYAPAPVLKHPLPDPETFKADCEKMRATLLKNRREFIDKEQPDDEVKTWTKNYVNLRFYNTVGDYLERYRRSSSQTLVPTLLTDNVGMNKKIEVPALKDFVNFGDDLNDIYNAKMLNADSYNLLYYLLPPYNRDDLLKQPADRMRDRIAQINGQNNNPLMKQLLIGDVFHAALLSNDPADFDKNRNLLDANVQASFIKQPLLKHYSLVKNNLADPQVKSNETLHDNKHPISQSATIMDTLISQNKGKIVYVDLWATWCAPCKATLPYTEMLKVHYKDNHDIKFAAVCLGSERNEWRAIRNDLKLTDDQYYVEPKQIESITSGLKLRSIPHYIIINKGGEIISNSDGLRPNDPLTVKTLDKLLGL